MTLVIADVLLQLSLNPGAVYKYAVVREFREPDGSGQIRYSEDWTFTVEPGTGGKRKVKVTSLLRQSVFDGTVVPSTDNVPTQWSEERAFNGQVVSRDPDLYFPVLRGRQWRPLDVKFSPDTVAVGSTWEWDKPADPDAELSAALWKWTLSAATESEATLTLAFAERGTDKAVTADGTIRIDRKDGWPTAIDVTVRNTEVPGDEEHSVVNLHVTWKRV